jgi:hypothetical protein
VIANEFVGFNAQQWIVDILASDLAFETDSDCGTWSTSPRPVPNGIPGGVWLVGAQIPPGTYTVNARSGCYWERLRNFTGTLSGIIDNEFVSNDSFQLVNIASTDVGFSSNADCGTWTRIGAARSVPTDDDIVMRWLANYQHHTGNEPRPLIKR